MELFILAAVRRNLPGLRERGLIEVWAFSDTQIYAVELIEMLLGMAGVAGETSLLAILESDLSETCNFLNSSLAKY